MGLPSPKRDRSTSLADLNEALKGEISAFQTYGRAMGRLSHLPHRRELAQFRAQHNQAISQLRRRIESLGGESAQSAGIWGEWVEGIEQASRSVGEVAELDALREEEQDTVGIYREVLSHDVLDEKTFALIDSTLLPMAETRLERVRSFMRELPLGD